MANELRFRRLRLKNWKNFQNIDVEVQDRMFLVGANAAGKSNFLDVFRFLRDLASPGGGFGEAVGRRGGVGAVRCLAARRYSDVEIGVDVQEDGADRCWRYEIAFHQDNRRRPRLRRERVTLDGRMIVDRPDREDREDAARLTQTHIEQVNMNRRFRDLAAFFASVRYLHIVPQLVREPDRSVGRSNDPYGGDFLEQIARTPERTRNARLKKVEKALRVAVPQLEEIALTRDDRGVPHLRGKYRHWRAQGAWQGEGAILRRHAAPHWTALGGHGEGRPPAARRAGAFASSRDRARAPADVDARAAPNGEAAFPEYALTGIAVRRGDRPRRNAAFLPGYRRCQSHAGGLADRRSCTPGGRPSRWRRR